MPWVVKIHDLDVLKMLGKSERYSPKSWFDGDFPWYKVKNHQLNKSKMRDPTNQIWTYEPGSKLVVLGMAIPPLIGNPYNGYINPYYWVDDHPLLYGNNVSLDPSTYDNWVASQVGDTVDGRNPANHLSTPTRHVKNATCNMLSMEVFF